jgi:transposase
MFIRKKQNKSGSVSIQIIQKISKKRIKIIKHIGTGREKAEIDNLMREAKEEMLNQQLNLFDWNENAYLIEKLMQEILIKHTYCVGYEEVFGKVYEMLEYDKLELPQLIRTLVIARIAHPYSKLSIKQWLERKMGVKIHENSIYRLMDKMDQEVENKVCDHTFKKILHIVGGEIHIIFFDATTLHFETFKSDKFRKTGFSKVGKHNQPQVVIGLMVTREGLPIGYDVYPGNEFDGHTIRSAIKRVKRRYAVKKVVFVADAGMASRENMEMIDKAGFKFIISAKLKTMDEDTKNNVLNPTSYNKNDIYQTKYCDHRLVVSYSADRARKDQKDRENNVLRIKKKLASKEKITKTKLERVGKSKFLQVLGEAKVRLDYEAIREDSKWDGLKGYLTNLSKKELPADEVISRYTDLHEIENAFRISKQELRIRPIFHYKKERIRAHILTVFISLVILKYATFLLRDLKISSKALIDNVDTVQIGQLAHPRVSKEISTRVPLNDLMNEVYKRLEITI